MAEGGLKKNLRTSLTLIEVTWRIERGELNLTLTTLQKVAKGLGITVSALLKGIA